jgi:hypothetical protein
MPSNDIAVGRHVMLQDAFVRHVMLQDAFV